MSDPAPTFSTPMFASCPTGSRMEPYLNFLREEKMAKHDGRKQRRPKKSPPIVPREYGGKWVAWDRKMDQILSTGKTPAEVRNVAISAGEDDPVLEWIPPTHALIK